MLTFAVLLSGCGNSATRLYETDLLKPPTWRSVVVFGIASETNEELAVQSYLLDEQEFDECPIDSMAKAWSWGVDWPHVQYVAFSVPPGHYAFKGAYASDELGHSVFVVPPYKQVYLGDFVVRNGRAEVEYNPERARKTLVRYPLLNEGRLESAKVLRIDEAISTYPWTACRSWLGDALGYILYRPLLLFRSDD